MENLELRNGAKHRIKFRALRGTSSQRGWNSRKDSDIFHFPFSILN